MKTLRLLLCALLLPVLQARGEPAGDAETRLREFYAFYCHALEAGGDPLGHRDKLRPYVSARFLKELARLGKTEDGIDADPFVRAQDTDPAWEKNIRIAHVKADAKTASADVTLGGKGDRPPPQGFARQ